MASDFDKAVEAQLRRLDKVTDEQMRDATKDLPQGPSGSLGAPGSIAAPTSESLREPPPAAGQRDPGFDVQEIASTESTADLMREVLTELRSIRGIMEGD